VLLGTLLRLRQFFADRSIWFDEAILALNLTDRSWRGLLRPLDSGQAAPLGWLEVQRAVVVTLGSSDLALRLLPLLAGIALLVVAADVARRCLPAALIPCVVVLIAVSPSLVRYSTEIKQYETDALAVLVAVDLGLSIVSRKAGQVTWRQVFLVASVGFVVAVMSFVGVLALVVVLAVVILHRMSVGDSRGLCVLLLAGVGPAVGAVLQYVLVARRLHGDAYLAIYWQAGYPPPGAGPGATLRWVGTAGRHLVADPLHLAAAPLVALLIVGGVVVVFRRSPWTTAVLAAPLLTRLTVAVVRIYPLAGRLALDVVPLLLILLPAAACLVRVKRAGRRGETSPAGAALVAVVVAVAVVAVALPSFADAGSRLRKPMQITEIRPVLTQVAHERRADDQVWTYWISAPAVTFYARRLQLPIQQSVGVFAQGCGSEQQLFAGLRPGSRIWLVGGALDPREVAAPPGPGTAEDVAAVQVRFATYATALQHFDAHEAQATLYVVRPTNAQPAGTGRAVPPRDGMCLGPSPFGVAK
jgi:hypothetical protein